MVGPRGKFANRPFFCDYQLTPRLTNDFFRILLMDWITKAPCSINPLNHHHYVAENRIVLGDQPHFKQFVVTNCSKERPGSIVNETLKNGISMLKDISKESDFYADFKYISFIKFSLCHQKLRA